MPIPVERLRPILIEALRRDFGGQWIGLTQAVAWVATERRIYPELQDTRIVQLDAADEAPLRALVEALIAEGMLTLGTRPGNRRWPWLSLTERGRVLVDTADP